MTKKLDKKYWDKKYSDYTGNWDIGYASPPIKEYIDQIENRNIKILIPGAGNAYEAEYLHSKGFPNVFVLDISSHAVRNLKERVPGFPADRIIEGDFFAHEGNYDLIIEQTFFCAIDRNLRREYAKKMRELLNGGGKFIGLLFNHEFGKDEPPFGGTKEEYESVFSDYFNLEIFETARNSIKPRAGRELFFVFNRK